MKDDLNYGKVEEFDIDKASVQLGINDLDDDSPVLDLDMLWLTSLLQKIWKWKKQRRKI